MDAAEQVVAVNQREAIDNLVNGYDVDFEVKNFRHRCAAFEFFEALVVGCDRDRAALAIARRLAGFVLESEVEIARVLGKFGQIE